MKHSKKYITRSAKGTQKIAAKFAKQILRQKPGKTAAVLFLQGNLGAGKTTFVQGLAKGLGIKNKINSPTFVIVKRFPIPTKKIKDQKSKIKMTIQNSKFTNFYHVDCYRLNKPKEILDLGFKEIISNPKNIVAIEWPEKISRILPKNTLKIKFQHTSKVTRQLTFEE